MSQNFVEKAAAKASLINMSYDMKRLRSSYPRQPSHVSKELIEFTQNACLALLNGAAQSALEATIQHRQQERDANLQKLLTLAIELANAVYRKDESAIGEIGNQLESAYLAQLGVPISLPSLSASSTKPSLQDGHGGTRNGGCGCLILIGFVITAGIIMRLCGPALG